MESDHIFILITWILREPQYITLNSTLSTHSFTINISFYFSFLSINYNFTIPEILNINQKIQQKQFLAKLKDMICAPV